MGTDLQLATIAEAMRAMPDIAIVSFREGDELIPHGMWLIGLQGDWRGDHRGTGATIEEAYADAKRRTAGILRRAA